MVKRRALMLAGSSLLVFILAVAARGGETVKGKSIEERMAPYAPVELKVPWDLLGGNETAVLEKLYRASKVMDDIFLTQVSKDNADLRKKLVAEGDGKKLRFFDLNFGPWDRLEEHEPFVPGKEKPAGANFYPEDITKEELGSWLEAHPEDAEKFESNFTVIRRGEDGSLKAVPYSVEYRGKLEEAARYMNEAADLTTNVSLARFLRSRVAAFFSDDYYQSDMDWMDITDNLIDITIGPYEVYEDNLFNYKAAFESFLCIRDPEESKKLDGLKHYLQKMELNLPVEDRYKNLDRGSDSPIAVVDEIFSAGDTKAGVQTLAFNLPNDERVREAKGCKKVMLRNMCQAKFEKILVPIAEKVIDREQLKYLTFDAYFNHILLHEFSHGLGPGIITLEDGTETTVNKMLSNTYSAIEEAKADIVGEYNFYYLIDEGFYDDRLEKETAVSFLAGFFRSVRFGVEEAHGRANMIIFNFMKEKGAYSQDPATGLWSVDFAAAKDAVKALSHEILMIQARGDYEEAARYIEKYGEMGEDVTASLKKLEGVPVDIIPSFEIEKRYAVN
ncbi:MAG: peptidase [Candidatus Krumholzibacteriota bacterium]|nr:peptidase [Candidatus Krumholzibacteriota bacterium]